MGTLKLECIWQQRFATYDEARSVITAWIRHYNEAAPNVRPQSTVSFGCFDIAG